MRPEHIGHFDRKIAVFSREGTSMNTPKPVRRIEGDVYNVIGVYEDSDKTEGRGPQRLVGYYHVQADADEAAEGLGVFGQRGRTEVMQVLSMDGGRTGYPFHLDSGGVKVVMPGQKDLKRRALEKLTPDERAALGL